MGVCNYMTSRVTVLRRRGMYWHEGHCSSDVVGSFDHRLCYIFFSFVGSQNVPESKNVQQSQETAEEK